MIIPTGTNEENVGVKTYEKVLSLIENNNKITIVKMAKILNKNTKTIERAPKKLKDDKKLTRVGSDKTGHWEVKK